MANSLKGPLAAVILTTSDALIYTVPTSTKASVSIIINNTLGQQVSFRLHHVESGGSTRTNSLYYDKVLQANEVLTLSGVIMEAADTLRGLASINDAIKIGVYGIESV